MAVASYIVEAMKSSSMIRKMFEEGNRLKEQFGEENVYDFSLGNPDLEPPREVEQTIRRIAEKEGKGAHSYMPNAGYPAAREAMAAKVSAEQGVTVDGSFTVMSVGAAGALNSVLKAVLSAGDEVIVPSPYFAEYGHYVRNHGGVLRPVPTAEDFSLDIQAVRDALTEKTAAVLINSPNNPSGKIYSSDDIGALAAVLRGHAERTGRLPYVIADEPYREITYGGRSVAPVFPVYAASVIVSSFAKNLSLPGERIGYIAVNPSCPGARDLTEACIFTTRTLGFVNAPAFFQKVVAECWNVSVDYSSYERRRDALASVLRGAGIEFAEPEGAFYLFCKVPAVSDAARSRDDEEFCEHLKKFRILGVPGRGFGCAGWFRLAYCVSGSVISGSALPFKDAVAAWK